MSADVAQKLKWYFAANLNALKNAFDQIQGAVLSARQQTALQPICLVDDHDDPGEVADRLAWMVSAGVKVVPHKAELFRIVRAHFGASADVFSGHWLRCDIPLLETDAEFVLYTDIDVMFRKPFELGPMRPAVVACAPEHRQDDFSYFNSGVMVMNIPELRATRGRFVDVLNSRLNSMQPHDDQGVFNFTYRGRWTRLPNLLNWKPYWGYAPDAGIVHFHGPKPDQVRRMLAGEDAIFGEEFQSIFYRSPAGYREFLAEFDAVIATSNYAPDRSVGGWHRMDGGQLEPLLKDGWSGTETWGVWGVGAVHSLALRFADGVVGPIQVDFDVHAALFPTRPRQLVDILVDGEPVDLWRFTEAHNHAVRRITVTPKQGQTVSIELRPCTVFRVCDLDLANPDVRPLGVALHGVRITQA